MKKKRPNGHYLLHSMSDRQRIAVIGGGLCGLTCAIRLAEHDIDIDLFEAAPVPGGRTRSFFDAHVNQWVDNGPHLLVGAYHHTERLLKEAGADQYIHWQPSLELPLWDAERGHFQLAPPPQLPLALAMPWACLRLPGHHMDSATALLRLAMANRKSIAGGIGAHTTVHDWLQQIGVPQALIRDLLEPLCLAAMNETIQSANARSFSLVLREAFDSHACARLGWFTQPLSKALVEPLVRLAKSAGVRIHTSVRIRKLNEHDHKVHIETGGACGKFDAAIIALPARARNRLLNIHAEIETRGITNIHLWLADTEALPSPLIGGIGTTGQWFFDVSQQMREQAESPYRHICAVISADQRDAPRQQRISEVCRELQEIMGRKKPIKPDHVRMVREFHATTQVRPRESNIRLSERIIDASEAPLPGEFPATIEAAVIRGEQAAKHCRSFLNT